jgi:hypothetical protein
LATEPSSPIVSLRWTASAAGASFWEETGTGSASSDGSHLESERRGHLAHRVRVAELAQVDGHRPVGQMDDAALRERHLAVVIGVVAEHGDQRDRRRGHDQADRDDVPEPSHLALIGINGHQS